MAIVTATGQGMRLSNHAISKAASIGSCCDLAAEPETNSLNGGSCIP
jgi:hypothetical protein